MTTAWGPLLYIYPPIIYCMCIYKSSSEIYMPYWTNKQLYYTYIFSLQYRAFSIIFLYKKKKIFHWIIYIYFFYKRLASELLLYLFFYFIYTYIKDICTKAQQEKGGQATIKTASSGAHAINAQPRAFLILLAL